MNDNDTGQFHRRRTSAVGADRPHEISFDASVSLRRWNGLVRALDTVTVLGHLLTQHVVRHQRFDDGCRSQTASRKSLHAPRKVAAADPAMNKEIVEFDSLFGQLGSGWFHRVTPSREYITGFHEDRLEIGK